MTPTLVAEVMAAGVQAKLGIPLQSGERAALIEAFKACRNAALEEAAKQCDGRAYAQRFASEAQREAFKCGSSIRGLVTP